MGGGGGRYCQGEEMQPSWQLEALAPGSGLELGLGLRQALMLMSWPHPEDSLHDTLWMPRLDSALVRAWRTHAL